MFQFNISYQGNLLLMEELHLSLQIFLGHLIKQKIYFSFKDSPFPFHLILLSINLIQMLNQYFQLLHRNFLKIQNNSFNLDSRFHL